MRNFFKIFGIIAIAATIVLSTTGCENDPGGDTPQTVTYTGLAGDTIYTLKITENLNRAVYTPQAGDSYELTAGNKKSTGAVNSYASGIFTLKPENSEQTFTATVSGNHMTDLSGTIKWTNNETTSDTLKLVIPLTVSGTFSGTINGKSFGNILIYPFVVFYGEANNNTKPSFTIHGDKAKNFISPGNNTPWFFSEIPFTGTPTDILIEIFFNNGNYTKYFFYEVGNNYNESTRTLSGINIDVGNVKPITLSGTISNLPSEYDQNRWEIWAITKHKYGYAGSDKSQITISGNSATWSITLLSFKEETDIYFQLRGYKDNNREMINSTSFKKVKDVSINNNSLNFTSDFGNN